MRFSINLATRTYLDQRLLNQAVYGVIALLVLLLGWNITRVAWNLGEKRRLDSEIKAYETRLNSRPGGISEKDYSRQKNRIRFFNEIIDRKSLSWMKLLDQVEEATPDGIALSALTPAKKLGELKLEGRARSFANVRKYVERLEESKVFTNVLLLSHQELITGEHGRGVQFTITCKVPF